MIHLLFPAIQPVDLTPGFLFREEFPDLGPGGTGGVTSDTIHHPVPAMRPVFVIFLMRIAAAHHSLSWVLHRMSLPVQPVRRSSGSIQLLPGYPDQPKAYLLPARPLFGYIAATIPCRCWLRPPR